MRYLHHTWAALRIASRARNGWRLVAALFPALTREIRVVLFEVVVTYNFPHAIFVDSSHDALARAGGDFLIRPTRLVNYELFIALREVPGDTDNCIGKGHCRPVVTDFNGTIVTFNPPL